MINKEMLDKLATIKVGIMGVSLTGAVAVIGDLPWVAIFSILVAAVNILGVFHRMWVENQENRRKEALFQRRLLVQEDEDQDKDH